jgi:hypothetical protein
MGFSAHCFDFVGCVGAAGATGARDAARGVRSKDCVELKPGGIGGYVAYRHG